MSFHKSTRRACAKNISRLSASVGTLSVHQSGERFPLVRKMIALTCAFSTREYIIEYHITL